MQKVYRYRCTFPVAWSCDTMLFEQCRFTFCHVLLEGIFLLMQEIAKLVSNLTK